jgi:hypothetical protein
MKRYFREIHIRKELQLLLLVAIVVRIVFLLVYHPVLWPDLFIKRFMSLLRDKKGKEKELVLKIAKMILKKPKKGSE